MINKFKLFYYLPNSYIFQSSGQDSEVIKERSCERSSDTLLGNISYPGIIELRIQCRKLHSSVLDENFCHKFGLSCSNMTKLKKSLCELERKSELYMFALPNMSTLNV